MKKTWIGYLMSLAAIWGSSFLFMKWGASEFGSVATAGLRIILAALFLIPVLLINKQFSILRKSWKKIFLIGICNTAIPFVLFSYAVLSINTGLAAILNATAPLFGALIAWIWLKEQPSYTTILGLFVGFIGIVLLTLNKSGLQTDIPIFSLLACLGATLCYGIGAVATRHYLKGTPALVLATGNLLASSIVLIIPTILFWPAQTPSFRAWGSILTIALVCTSLAYVIFFALIERAGAHNALTTTFVTPLFALFYGWIFLHEAIQIWTVFCGLIIISGTALSMGFFNQFFKKLSRI